MREKQEAGKSRGCGCVPLETGLRGCVTDGGARVRGREDEREMLNRVCLEIFTRSAHFFPKHLRTRITISKLR